MSGTRSERRGAAPRGRGALGCGVALLIATLTIAPRASAQIAAQNAEWNPYSTSVYSEGTGLPVGDRQSLHIGGALETGYDNNVFYLPTALAGSTLLRARGRINLATRPPADAQEDRRAADPIVAYKAPVQLEYREYFSPNPDVQAQRSLNIMADPAVTLWPAWPISVTLADAFVRSADPRNAETFKSFTRDYNRASLVGRAYLGGGRLELALGGYFQTNLWEAVDASFADNMGAEGRAFARWRFTHDLAASLLVRAGYLHYANTPVLNSRPLRSLLTVSDQLTSWFLVSAGAGYGNSLALDGTSYSGPLATVAAQFTAPWQGTAELRYERDFFDSLFAHVYTDDRVALVYEQPFEHDFTARVEGSVRLRQYSGLLDPAVLQVVGYSSPERHDQIYDGRAEVAYRLTPAFLLALTYNLQVDATSFQFLTAGGPTQPSYVKHSVFLRAEFGN